MRGRSRVAAVVATALLAGTVAIAPVESAPAPAPVLNGLAAVPRPDHIVLVIDENHSGSNIIGNPNAPWINALAAQNANMTQSYALTHPSQPNYIALFSGATQGVTDDSCPKTFTTPNLGTSLAAAGLGFAGYSEGLPATGSTVCGSGRYVRKHNPWVDFPAVPASANRPWSAFPTDYSTLPEVSVVVPDLVDDMHDGTIAQGDAWLQNNLSGYVEWAKTHNSLFVLTFDEDDNHEGNRIPTVFAGQQVRPGSYDETINHYNLLRTIEDAYGLPPVGASATSAPILDVWAAPAGDAPPVAAFTPSCVQLSCSFDGTASTDPDGAVVDHRWTFGDGTTGSGLTAQHTYASGGTYPVALTVVDDQGVATTLRTDVVLADPPGAVFVSDSFGRTVANDWGQADVGGAWSLSGASSSFSVSPGTGSIRVAKAGAQAGAAQPSVVRSDVDLVVGLELDALPVGGPVYLTVQGRRVSSAEDYSARVLVYPDRTVTIRVTRRLSGVETVLAGPVRVAGLSYTPGTVVDVRVQVTGTSPSTVRARTWAASGVEPTTWPVSASDSTAGLQAGGSIGVTGYVSSAVTGTPPTIGVTTVTAGPTTSAPAAVAPTAAFVGSCVQLACTFDGTGSADPDGTVVAWAWDFGDGTVGTGPRPVHSYVVGGVQTVVLTVTDDTGRTGTVSHQVTAAPPPSNTPPVAAFTSSCVRLTCTFDGTSSADDEGVEGWTWDFGDGTSGSGATVPHTYAADGTFVVRLTVLDDDDATANVSHPVVVAASAPFASDTFARTVSGGWGTADVGGAWTVSGAASLFSVATGTASVRLAAPGAQAGAYLAGTARTETDLVVGFRLDRVPVGGPVYVTVQGRRVTASDDYSARVLVNADRSVTVRVTRRVGGVETALAGPVKVAGATYAPGAVLAVRLQVLGTAPTTVRARVWPASGTQPTAWPVSATDAGAALQKPGAVGVAGYLSSGATTAPVTLGIASVTAAAPS